MINRTKEQIRRDYYWLNIKARFEDMFWAIFSFTMYCFGVLWLIAVWVILFAALWTFGNWVLT